MTTLEQTPQHYVDFSIKSRLEELESRVKELESSGVGVGKRIVYGTAIVEWPVKAKESAETVIVTGLTEILGYSVGYIGSPQIVANGVASAGNISVHAFYISGEIESKTKASVVWMAIGK